MINPSFPFIGLSIVIIDYSKAYATRPIVIIPSYFDHLFWTCMFKIWNTGISYLYLA